MAELQEMDQGVADEQPQSQPATLGEVLQAARVAKQLTQQDISNSLRYSVKQINALEQCEFDLLPDAMITRGFIRSYAKLLEIDAEPLLASYRQSVSSESDKVIAVRSSMRPVQLTKESQPWLKYILASILVLLFLLAWLFYVDYMPKPSGEAVEKTSEVIEEAAPAATESLPEIALPAAQRMAESDAVVPDLAADPNAAINTATQPATVAADVKPLDTVTQSDLKPLAPPVNQQMQVPVTASPVTISSVKPADKTLSMSFTAQTWVSVADKSGKVVYEKMSHSGDLATINAAPPLNLVIGNASGTKLNFGGKDIDLAPNTKDNVARITLE
jgi:cytoskeleton protein RodZ